MEAAAILLHGQSLPPDRSLWPSYMSGGTLPSPTSATTPTPSATTTIAAAAKSPSAAATSPPASHFDDEELAGVSEEGEDEDEDGDEADEDDEENALTTDESDVPEHGRARSQSLALPAPVQSHMPNLVGSYGSVGSHMLPASSSSSFAKNAMMPAAAASYGWGVIAAESGQHASFNGIGIYGPKSPVSESHASPRLPVTINQHPHLPHGQHHHQHHRSLSSFSSFTHSFGSSSTSSYIPSSSLRSSSDLNGQEEEEDEEMMLGGGGGDSYNGNGSTRGEDDEEEFDYNFQRATTLCRRLTAVSVHKGHHARGDSAASASASSPYHDGSSNKSVSPDRRRDEDMYELEMDMD
ncbi:hypothetical protein M408DRAFT_228017 [Serendipita vermifera MAFF 305830]|uniref:Uncharacterized protein n=1 Tax=Serendipita vermifera MAFF 305830 TaxID=933852 RepID=A0A0C3AY19_SERVB|nr:hypothetical protein M408DRAFT_228017 [Serendipita vermifera MAFF 305830]